jgi:uncharacterized protein (DUF433 family)
MNKKIINVDPDILSGAPVFHGTRVPVKNLFDYIETGETIDSFLNDFPSVSREQAIALLETSQILITKSYEILNETIA